jgi:hypothetical protein
MSTQNQKSGISEAERKLRSETVSYSRASIFLESFIFSPEDPVFLRIYRFKIPSQ